MSSAHPLQRQEPLGPILSRRFKAYGPVVRRSVLQLATTGALFIALLVVMAAASDHQYWLTLLLAVPAAGLLVRLFIIQHDCGHGSYFKSRAANDGLGRALSVLTLTPYGNWSQGHAAHHASTGNLDWRGRGDVETWTVAEYQAAAPLRKLLYRLYRSPLVMVILGAPINFILLQRLPLGRAFRDRQSRRNIRSGLRFDRRSAGGDDLSSHDDHRLLDRQLAILRAAPVRTNPLGARR